ncbi:dehydrodolichyl diphosphate synthase 2 [Benincasa hispida]|uniref:dehydrodolichyl diphosphate synthase 2 n=1 Tax=Benincasa hispida TaxID=102211 RepID=UPI0019015703|nr:dehydrodolichyl diphosphate synthase 2 [Benincasa hispida]
MFSLQFPIPVENLPNPPKFLFGGCALPKAAYAFERRRFSNHRLRAADVAAPVAEEAALPPGLQKEFLPRHVAVIMDGNVRWARGMKLPDSKGHDAGVRSLREMVDLCLDWDIPVLSVFAFSYDNWLRSKREVDFLMFLFERVLKSEMEKSSRKGIRLSVIGDLSLLPKSLQNLINEAVERTKSNTKLQLIVAASYSGRYDVVQACRSLARKVKNDEIQVEDIDDSLIEQELETKCTDIPHPDLLIRTSGELRISNFLLWQSAYTEFFFTETLWPDFRKDDFVQALLSYQTRQRRYGGRQS